MALRKTGIYSDDKGDYGEAPFFGFTKYREGYMGDKKQNKRAARTRKAALRKRKRR